MTNIIQLHHVGVFVILVPYTICTQCLLALSLLGGAKRGLRIHALFFEVRFQLNRTSYHAFLLRVSVYSV